jgi:hypothetical protein
MVGAEELELSSPSALEFRANGVFPDSHAVWETQPSNCGAAAELCNGLRPDKRDNPYCSPWRGLVVINNVVICNGAKW